MGTTEEAWPEPVRDGAIMLTESFIAAVLAANKPAQHLATSLKDVGIFLHELQPSA